MLMQLYLPREIQTLVQTQRTEIKLQQIVEFSNLMSVPDEVFNTVVGAVCYNPEIIEKMLQEQKRENSLTGDNSKKIRSLYSSLIPSKGNSMEERDSKLITSPDLRNLENCLGQYSAIRTPDVTYIGRKNEKPEVVFSDHLNGSMNLKMLQLNTSKYPETTRLMTKLKIFDEWKRRTLKDSYVAIGETQREFFENFDETKFHIFRTKNLADTLGFSEGTIYKVLSNRFVEARNTQGDQRLINTRDLLINPDQLKKYFALPRLNEVFFDESMCGKAYSDRKIAQKIGLIATRTVAKYRQNAGIPNTTERNRAYRDRERTEPYKIN